MKICSACRQAKPLDMFYANAKARDGRHIYCIPCDKARRRAYHARTYVKDVPRISMTSTERSRKYRNANAEKVRAYHAEHAKKNAAAYSARAMKRHAAKLNATPAWANLDAIEKFYKLAQLMSELSGMRYEVDHVVPLQSNVVCGLHCESNLQIMLLKENRAKSNKTWPDMP